MGAAAAAEERKAQVRRVRTKCISTSARTTEKEGNGPMDLRQQGEKNMPLLT